MTSGGWLGRVAVRRSGSFNIQTGYGVVQGISVKLCRQLQRVDGYGYSFGIINRKEGTFLPGVKCDIPC